MSSAKGMLCLENHGEEAKDFGLNGLGRQPTPCSAMTNAMESNLPDMIRDVMQTNHHNGAPGIDKSHRMIRS